MCTIFRQNGASHVRQWGGQSGRQSLLVKRHKAICVGGSGLGPFPSAEPSQKTFYKVRARGQTFYTILLYIITRTTLTAWTRELLVWVYRDLIKARPLLPRRSIYSIYLGPTFHMWWNFPVHFVGICVLANFTKHIASGVRADRECARCVRALNGMKQQLNWKDDLMESARAAHRKMVKCPIVISKRPISFARDIMAHGFL
jgi:hypothetical protein